MLKTVEAVYIYIYIVRFNKIKRLNIEEVYKAMYFRRN